MTKKTFSVPFTLLGLLI